MLQGKKGNAITKGEGPGLSVFFKEGETIYHTYSTYARGLDGFLVTHRLLDVSPIISNPEIRAGILVQFRS
jgi:predicted dithiol-disulfide oxidoreductase (DUF899 family)